MNELVVISANGSQHVNACVESWQHTPTPRLLLDTGSGQVPGAEANVGPVWQTGAYIHAYQNTDADAFLFTQDTVTVMPGWPDPVAWFRERMPGDVGAVGWQLFPMDWHRVYADGWYADPISKLPNWSPPPSGIVGPIFYATRRALDRVAELELLPYLPRTRDQASGSERTWAYAFALAGVPLAGEPFVPNEIPARVTEYGPLRKVWMH